MSDEGDRSMREFDESPRHHATSRDELLGLRRDGSAPRQEPPAAPEGSPATRRLLPVELEVMTGVLADAFMTDPLYLCLAPSPRAREHWLRWMMGLFLRVSDRFGCAFCLERAPNAGVVCLIPPDPGVPSLWDYLRAAPGMPPVGRAGAVFVRRGLPVLKLLNDAHFTGPHYYLLAVAVAPREQGKGVGGALLRSALGMAAVRGVPCYLETASPTNVLLYESLGFRVQQAFAPKDLPPLWTMLCPATPERPERGDARVARAAR
jgi:ribosomal protein S18 acetylase RimI-like enzyme